MRLPHQLLTGLAIVAIVVGAQAVVAVAQDEPDPEIGDACIADHVCVEVLGQLLAVDPLQGHYQEVVVEVRLEDRTITIQDLEGERTEERDSERILLIPLTAKGETYLVGDPIPEERKGIYADADLRDVYVMTEAS
jgi:hypothetical protein